MMKVGAIDPVALMDAARAKDEGHAGEVEFERELAKLLVREVSRSLKDILGDDQMGIVQHVLEESLVDRLVGDGLFSELAQRAPLPHHGPAPRSRHSLPVRGRITSTYGMRTDPIHGGRRKHNGVDIAAREGTPVSAPRSGVVRFAGKRGGYGNVVIVDHGGGLETWYAHLQSIRVTAGSRVGAGQNVGSVGQTGRATGPHLHLEVRQNGRSIDPARIFPDLDPKAGHGHDR